MKAHTAAPMTRSPLALAHRAESSRPGAARVFRQVLAPGLHPAPARGHSRAASILSNRSALDDSVARRLPRAARDAPLEEGSALFNPLVCRAKTVKKNAFVLLQAVVLQRARAGALIGSRPEGIIDATGLETRHVSRYYVWRRGQKRFARLHWPKLTLVCHRQSHLLPGAFVSLGLSLANYHFLS